MFFLYERATIRIPYIIHNFDTDTLVPICTIKDVYLRATVNQLLFHSQSFI